jgi:hypothetical protein
VRRPAAGNVPWRVLLPAEKKVLVAAGGSNIYADMRRFELRGIDRMLS